MDNEGYIDALDKAGDEFYHKVPVTPRYKRRHNVLIPAFLIVIKRIRACGIYVESWRLSAINALMSA